MMQKQPRRGKQVRPILTGAISALVLISVVVGLTFARSKGNTGVKAADSTLGAATSAPNDPDTSVGVSTTAATWADRYPIAPAETIELYADSLDQLPDIAVRIDGYQVGGGQQFDTMRLFQNDFLIVPPQFDQLTGGMHECNRNFWILRWSSVNPDVLVHGEVGSMFWFTGGDETPENPGARAGYLAGNACDRAGFWFDKPINGNLSNLVDVEYRIQFFSKLPSELERPSCQPLMPKDSLPLELCNQGESVRKVQERLVSLGVAELSVDGQFGPATEEAVKAFQLDRGLPVNGIVTTSTWNELFPGEPAPT